MKGSAIALIAAVLVVMGVFISKNMSPDVNSIIKEIVRSVNDTFYQIKTDPDLSNAKCYRDGDKKGIVMEYNFSKDVDKSKIDPEKVKLKLTKELKHRQDIDKLASLGIYFVVIYNNHKGDELLRVTITPEMLMN